MKANYNIDAEYHLGQRVFIVVERNLEVVAKCEICTAVQLDDHEECPRCSDIGTYPKHSGTYWDCRGEATVTEIIITHDDDGAMQISYTIIGKGFYRHETKRVYETEQAAMDATVELNSTIDTKAKEIE